MFQLAATADDPLWPYDSQAAKSQLGCSSALAAGVRGSGLAKSCSEHAYQYSVSPKISSCGLKYECLLIFVYRFVIHEEVRWPRYRTWFVSLPINLLQGISGFILQVNHTRLAQ